MQCMICRKDFEWMADVPYKNPMCPSCLSAQYESDMARHRAKRIYYNKELVIIGKAEFECSGYYFEGELCDEEVTMTGREMYGLLNTETLEQIGAEIIRRIESKLILKEIEEIEKALPDSKDPAGLRLRRSELDEKLEALEARV